MIDCFIGLGGNFPATLEAMRKSIAALTNTPGIQKVRTSRLYQTAPVSDIAQPPFLNAACRFECELSLEELWKNLQAIEIGAGKHPKPKNAPRLIDIDLLFYGDRTLSSPDLTLPHPHWHERLFVIAPLADLVDLAKLPGIDPLQQTLPFQRNDYAYS